MIYSVRRFLFISLIIIAAVALLITTGGSYWLSKQILAPSLANHIISYFILIMLVTYVSFAIVSCTTLIVLLRSIMRLTNHVSRCAPASLKLMHSDKITQEIMPLAKKLNQLLARLKRAFERSERFSADTAHELRTPLAALKIQAQVALKTIHDEKMRDVLLKVTNGVDRCSHVVTQLLTLSTLSQEGKLNDMRPINLHQLTVEILTQAAPIAVNKKIDIELIPPPADHTILGNDIALGILIRNLVDNAIRYTPAKGAVTVTIMNTTHSVLLRVTDTGSGIPEELRERVFDRFYRVQEAHQTGSGLGLAIVKQIVELHHAHISLDTPKNGVGLQIEVTFPKPASHKKRKNKSKS